MDNTQILTAAQIEKEGLKVSQTEFDRLIAIGWNRRDAARHATMAYEQTKSRLHLRNRALEMDEVEMDEEQF